MDAAHWDSAVKVLELIATKILDITRTTKSKMNTVVMSSYWAMYPDMTGKTILAKEPAEANHPCNVPCGLLLKTVHKTGTKHVCKEQVSGFEFS